MIRNTVCFNNPVLNSDHIFHHSTLHFNNTISKNDMLNYNYKSLRACNCFSMSSSVTPAFDDSPSFPLCADGASAICK